MNSTPTSVSLRAERGQRAAGRYRLEEFLGAGGTSEVWRAVDERLGRVVAIKILKSELVRGNLPARVEQEARAAAQLRHPAVVEIYDVGHLDSGLPFLALEYLVGRTVAEVVEERGPMSAVDAVSALLPICDALAAAHEAGVVHRDVKPDNIFLARFDRSHVQPKIVDFGVAKVALPASQRLTVVGTVVGTPVYMAPEQTIGDARVGAPADVWALGVTIYEMTTGRLPFEGASLDKLFPSILTAPLPYPRHLDDFDSELFSILASMTRKRAVERPTADELTAQFRDFLLERGVRFDLSGRSLEVYGAAASSSAPTRRPVESRRPATLGGVR